MALICGTTVLLPSGGFSSAAALDLMETANSVRLTLAGRLLARSIGFLSTYFAFVYDNLNFIVEDSGFVVDLGVYSAPKSPRSPFPPRSFCGPGSLWSIWVSHIAIMILQFAIGVKRCSSEAARRGCSVYSSWHYTVLPSAPVLTLEYLGTTAVSSQQNPPT